MAHYDWFLRCINKITSDKPMFIDRIIFIADKEHGVRRAIVMDVRNSVISYKTQTDKPPEYGEVQLNDLDITWSFNFNTATNIIDTMLQEECEQI